MTGDLPDVNVWVAMTVPHHALHHAATNYWNEESVEPIVFCRTTALGLVRVCSGKNATGGNPLSIEESWRKYLRWRADEDVSLMGDPYRVDEELDRLIALGVVSSKNSTDAYLAAFAISAGLRLVTFDAGFERFPGLDLLRL